VNLLTNKGFAGSISFFMILVAVFGLGGNRLAREQQSALESRSGLFEQIEIIWGQGRNVGFVMENPLLEENLEALRRAKDENDLPGLYHYTNLTVREIDRLFNEADENLVYITGNVIAAFNLINLNDYNQRAAEFNALLEGLVPRLIAGIRGIEPLELFAE